MVIKKAVALGTAAIATAVAGVLTFGSPADANEAEFKASLQDPRGRDVGTVKFSVSHHATYVVARFRLPEDVARNAFHGFHIHANNVPGNGEGCVADPAAARATWFASADGHLSAEPKPHGLHQGDLPSPLVMADGTALIKFTTDRIAPADLAGRAVILHSRPDNFGNIPVGPATTDYKPNTPAATDLTARTGNASTRLACGVIQPSGWGKAAR